MFSVASLTSLLAPQENQPNTGVTADACGHKSGDRVVVIVHTGNITTFQGRCHTLSELIMCNRRA